MLPNKPGGVPRVDDRDVRNGIFRVLRSGAPWCDLPESFGPYTTCCNRFAGNSMHGDAMRQVLGTSNPPARRPHSLPALPAVLAYISHAGSTVPDLGRAG